jgi:hypothetical protein
MNWIEVLGGGPALDPFLKKGHHPKLTPDGYCVILTSSYLWRGVLCRDCLVNYFPRTQAYPERWGGKFFAPKCDGGKSIRKKAQRLENTKLKARAQRRWWRSLTQEQKDTELVLSKLEND